MILLILLFIFFISNNYITTTCYSIPCKKQPKSTKPLTIVHISDLHNKRFGLGQSYLLQKIRLQKPDFIAVTGDLIDGIPFRHAVTFIRKAAAICPVYLVRGNHEAHSASCHDLEKQLSKYPAAVLKNESAPFSKNGRTCLISGIDDPDFEIKYGCSYVPHMQKTLNNLVRQPDFSAHTYHILLSHRPELLSLYSRYPFDLVLCGHAHGGQIRPPFTDGLYAPNQGIFPKYASGSHTRNGTTEIISRGLGNSVFPLRLLNFPEVVTVRVYL